MSVINLASRRAVEVTNDVWDFVGVGDPSTGTGFAAGIGSLFVRTDGAGAGTLYSKTSAPATGWVIVTGSGASGAPIGSTYITVTGDAALTNERTLAVTTDLSLNDAGANAAISLGLASKGTPGTYQSVTTDAKGQVTAGTNPTTLAGYGITDAGSAAPVQSVFGRTGTVAAASNDYTFAQLAAKPTTVAGYGITDLATASPVQSVFGRTGAVVAAASDYTFAQLASKPTTIAGYGITDTLTNTVFGRSGTVVAAANDYTFAQIAAKPTTIAGYGITDNDVRPRSRQFLLMGA